LPPPPPRPPGRSYKSVLQRHPGAPAEVRLGLAACYYRAGRMELAQAAFERRAAARGAVGGEVPRGFRAICRQRV
jgi:hypothetical protein